MNFSVNCFFKSTNDKAFSDRVSSEAISYLSQINEYEHTYEFEKDLTFSYFYNLNHNVPNNSNGTCSYVSMSMILSFYDVFLNDSFIDEKFEKKEVIYLNENSFSWTESPAIQIDLSIHNNESFSSIVEDNYSEYLDYFLINKSYEYGNYKFALTQYEQISLLSNYLMFDRYLSTNVVQIVSCDNYDEIELDSFIKENLSYKYPVVLNTTSTLLGNHTMVAYGYDHERDAYYVHTGLRDYNNESLSCVLTSDIQDLTICGAYCLKYTGDAFCSMSFMNDSEEEICVCSLFGATSIEPRNSLYRDLNPCLDLDYNFLDIIEEDITNCSINVLDQYNTMIFDGEVLSPYSSYSFSLNDWNNVISNLTGDKFFVYISFEFSFGHESDSLYTFIENLDIPTQQCNYNSHLIKPEDWGYTGNHRGTYIDLLRDPMCTTKLIRGTSNDGCDFFTTHYRTRFDYERRCFVMSFIHTGENFAYIEFTFATPIVRIDFEASIWNSFDYERIGNPNREYKIGLDYYREDYVDSVGYFPSYRNGITLFDSISDINMFSNDGSYKLFSATFPYAVNRIRFYGHVSEEIRTSQNLGRICLGKMYVSEERDALKQEFMEPSGSELSQDEEFWNNDTVRYNCYSYAFNMINSYRPSPGNSDGYSWENFQNYFSGNSLEKLTYIDSINQDFYFRRLDNKFSICSEGHYKVALVCSYSDFHWYRQNQDGTWSHKAGVNFVTNCDSNRNVILDPENLPNDGMTLLFDNFSWFTYPIFVGFYEVSSNFSLYDGNNFEMKTGYYYLNELNEIVQR